jgi:hypothetical protein
VYSKVSTCQQKAIQLPVPAPAEQKFFFRDVMFVLKSYMKTFHCAIFKFIYGDANKVQKPTF